MRTDSAALFAAGFFAPIDYYFACFITQKAGCADEAVLQAAALVSRQTRAGHVCLDLHAMAGERLCLEAAQAALQCPSLDEWTGRLAESGCVGAPGDIKPLILDAGSRLYLYRLYSQEQRLAHHILDRAARTSTCTDPQRLAESLERLFPLGPDARCGLAAFSAAVKPLCIICGGPGTGKTTTAARILALLLEQGQTVQRIFLTAPTGKAADRLHTAVAGALKELPVEQAVKTAIPCEAVTLHRLLGIQPARPGGRYTGGRRLPADIVVVDEASMVDLPLMTCLFDALHSDARVILLGDHNQLASVAPGSVLGDICRVGSPDRYSDAFLRDCAAAGHVPTAGLRHAPAVGPLDDCVNALIHNYRFSNTSGIATAARAVAAGDADAALNAVRQAGAGDIGWCELPPVSRLRHSLKDSVLEGFREYRGCDDPVGALVRFERFRILCALREGPFGVQALNALVEDLLEAEGLIERHGAWYHGRPVLISRNHYPLRLFNGDIGIAWTLEKDAALRVCFSGPDGALRTFSPDQLPAHETAYAITVHKAQGSEFDRALLLLPDRPSPVLTRELVYTGLTRVRSRIDVWAKPSVLSAAVSSRSERSSGLLDAVR